MHQLKEGKAPGPDGFTTTFFHTFWELIKEEVWLVVEESHTLQWLLPSLNSTFMVLIAKEEITRTPDKFRPIALCNVIYKVISKKMITTFGFSPMWVRWVMSLISSTFFSILINGIPSRPFSPSRGIRHGDPLSPFLFVLMVEGLDRHIKQALLSRQLKGLSIHNLPAISHQQFVDDNMLFGYPSVQEASLFKSLLNDFLEASGTSINQAKSQIYFFHTALVTQFSIARIVGFTVDSLPSKYLGAPLIASTLKHASWHILLEKLESHLNL
eukprot:PITA_30885